MSGNCMAKLIYHYNSILPPFHMKKQSRTDNFVVVSRDSAESDWALSGTAQRQVFFRNNLFVLVLRHKIFATIFYHNYCILQKLRG